MAPRTISQALLRLSGPYGGSQISDPLLQCLAPRWCRSFASITSMPRETISENINEQQSSILSSTEDLPSILGAPDDVSALRYGTSSSSLLTSSPSSQVLTTLYSWPQIEPTKFAWYNNKHLALPLRRDLLHRAVIYEADATRRGTASTKWRADIHGSNRKLFSQKGTGRARAGDKKSPIRRGGGVAFGPHPRDFASDLQRKVYDLAWRTALSYRYKKGELLILDNQITLLPQAGGPRLLANIFEANQWGKSNGRSLLITKDIRRHLYESMSEIGEHGLVKDIEDVDVKDLLETGRVIIEQDALNTLLAAHSSDLGQRLSLAAAVHASKDWIVRYSA